MAAAACIGFLTTAIVAPAPAQAAVQASVISTATYPLPVEFDSAGNIWIGYAKGPMTPKGVAVIPAANCTIFGVLVAAAVETQIFDIDTVQGLVMSPAGHLFVATDKGQQEGLWIATKTNTAVFGLRLQSTL